MKILLAGGSGFIGGALGKELVRQGHDIVLLSRNPKKAIVPFPCEKIAWSELNHLKTPIDAVINLVGEPVVEGKWTAEKKKQLIESRRSAAEKINHWVLKSKTELKAYVGASAIGYYGDRGDEDLHINSEPGKDFLAKVCVEWERAHLQVKAEDHTIVRVGIVLDWDKGALKQMIPPFRWGGGGRIGSGRQWMSWIHIEDLVAIFIKALSAKEQILLGTSPHPVRNKDFTKILAKSLGVPAIVPVPKFGLKVLFGEKADVLTTGQRVAGSISGKFDRLEEALKNIIPSLSLSEELIVYEQYVDRPIEQVWPFFANEKNLERITPEFLNFKVKGKSTDEIAKGTLIDYTISLHGIPMNWRTEITEYEEGVKFADTQLKGPYSLWYHEHFFEKLGSGTLITDKVRYALPVGVVGKAAAGWYVNHDVETIFNYRLKAMDEIFST